MTNFEQAYKYLNQQQKQAVDAIDGPVMVIAGPGTGKTQLLSVRVANILKQTDAVADNILCLTYTDAAANEMRQRLVQMIGQQGYDVNVMTFHGFGTDVINRYGQYFYNGANMRPIDDITRYEIIENIFKTLPHNNPFASKHEDKFTYIKSSISAIGELKKAAINPERLRQKLSEQQNFLDQIQPILEPVFSDGRISKATIPKLEKAFVEISQLKNPEVYFIASLNSALETQTTPPITKWKSKWLEKDHDGNLILKDYSRITKLTALADVYEQYQKKLNQGRWFDYDDMIMQVIEQLSANDNLRSELQEQYQYILVDEFQDTNDGQLRLVKLLIDNPASDGKPNILVVGDDDQAIYKFQGADITNMHQFASWVDSPTIITLSDIYRYSKPLLELSNKVIDNAEVRLKDKISSITKNLKAVPEHEFHIDRFSYEDEFAEYDAVARHIKDRITKGIDPNTIAVIARQHDHLENFAVYANHHDIALNYDRQEDILSQPIIIQMLNFAKVVYSISKAKRKQTNELMPELLSYKFWQIDPVDLWKLNAGITSKQTTWMDAMLEDKKFEPIARYLLDLAQIANNNPLSITLDSLIGAPDGYFYRYYFATQDGSISSEYLVNLASLKTLRQKVIDHSGEDSTLADLFNFVEIQRQAGFRLVSNSPVLQADSAVSLMSAHSSKGVEFDHVYILHAQNNVWGEGKSGGFKNLSWTSNLNISPAGEDHDDRVRLFYVTITRAKHSLFLASARQMNNKASLPLRMLEEHDPAEEIHTPANDLAQAYITDWTSSHIDKLGSNKHLLKQKLDNYRLSISDLQSFVDVANGGPANWFINNFLRFPSPSNGNMAFGSAVHNTLSEAQKYLIQNSKNKSITEILKDFEQNLKRMDMSKSDFDFFLERGKISLSKYLTESLPTFKPEDKTEVSFFGDNIVLNDAKLTGQADRINLAEGNWQTGKIEVVDFKTGKPTDGWKAKDKFEKTKLHKYKQQLLFYELLVSNSKRFSNLEISNLKIDFVEPNKNDEIISLSFNSTPEELQRLSLLISAVWEKINQLELPDISGYSSDFAGITAFEQDLIDSLN